MDVRVELIKRGRIMRRVEDPPGVIEGVVVGGDDFRAGVDGWQAMQLEGEGHRGGQHARDRETERSGRAA